MIKLFMKKQGAVSVFLVIILVPIITISSIFVDMSRVKLARSVVDSAGDLALNTVLSQYDPDLNDFYGLMASSQSIDEFLVNVEDYFTASIASQGVDTNDAKKYAGQIAGILKGQTEVNDLLQITLAEEAGFSATKVDQGSLVNPAIVKAQVVDFMKFRSPINAVGDLLEKFKKSSKDLSHAADNTDLMDKKQKFYEAEGDFCEKAYELYKCFVEYNALGITDQYIKDAKKNMLSYEQQYKAIHTKIVKDLFNTQGYGVVKNPIEVSPKEETYDSDHKADAKALKKCMKDTCKSIDEYVKAKLEIEKINELRYTPNQTYDIQFWIHGIDYMKTHTVPNDYVKKANEMCSNYAKLANAIAYAEDGVMDTEELEIDYDQVFTSGNKTLNDHYKSVKSQFESIKKNTLQNNENVINRIVSISEKAIRENLTTITSTDEKIKAIHKEINEYYDKMKKGKELLGKAADLADELKDLADAYQEALGRWETKANKTNTTLAEEDRSEISDVKKVAYKVTAEEVTELKNRINNIKTILGTVQKAASDAKYNNKPIKDLSDYKAVKAVCKIEKDKIPVTNEQLKLYARDTFSYSSSEALNQIKVTKKNSPDLKSVNSPKLYEWIMKKFQNIKPEELEQGKKDYQNEKDKADKNLEEVEVSKDQVPNIAGQANLPSEGYKGYADVVKPTSNLSQIGKFVSGLFTNFSDTVLQTGTQLRDSLFGVDYITSMFSYESFENEGKYAIAKSQNKKVTFKNHDTIYKSVEGTWKSDKLTDKYNKTLTNKMINAENNVAFGNEVEYILYGGTNDACKSAATGSVFMTRFALNLPIQAKACWNMREIEGKEVNTFARSIQVATYGIIPASLVKIAICLALTVAESVYDVKALKAGIPVPLIKKEKERYAMFGSVFSEKNTSTDMAFSYSDYLKLFLFIKMINPTKENEIYTRTADVIQVNMQKKSKGFVMSKAQVYFKIEATAKVHATMLQLPINQTNEIDMSSIKDGYDITYSAIKGY